MKTTRVAINGFGRIGRAFVRRSWNRPEIELVAVNDLGSIDNLAYLLAHDTVYGTAPFPVSVVEGDLMINNKKVQFLSEKDPAQLPWKDLNIDVVVEATGFFTQYDKAQAHVTAGARRVVISAPGKGEEGSASGATILMGVNTDKLKEHAVSSNGSCTTNASSPVIAILNDMIGIDLALLNTTHAYTATQAVVDGSTRGSDFRKGRAAAQNIVPTSTGAAIAVTKAYPELVGRFDGIALRVPVPAGSIADITFLAKTETSVDDVNSVLEKAAQMDQWKGLFAVTREPLVSSDIVGQPFASIADLSMTRVVGGKLVKVLAWYDNEVGYTESLVRHVIESGNV
ncbi:MAG: type I glyceraldehyde-3-phosphate dehydrogenase [Parcubacteria group bacterium 21-54-25]|nr:MAG: type I glyceraldehyde-3-phosphate dehydrogenase [Parcubacteria group bacterium 21-54-25]HQU08312.1 glyceraldehyde 3-phosphate dehydrogenase NAD-binding domain-containing protein [Candidatus Paceibacterota bacterium]